MAEQAQKTVLVGVTGCIAAYKACEIVRGLQKAGCRVKVVMTPHATEFVGPTTFRGLTREPVAVELFDEPGAPIHHISLAQEADLFLIAPCTGNVVAKIAWGVADDLLTTTALACTAPMVLAPAMNVNMYEAKATQDNFKALKSRGVTLIEADEGYLACGDVGKGRLADPAVIVERTLEVLYRSRDLEGKRVMITAGPTVEPLDAVRFVSNHSSGKQGFALAEAAAKRGAQVTLVSGPVALQPPAGVTLRPVGTAQQMLDVCQEVFATTDIAIFAAAVADYRPANPAEGKLKKGRDDAQLASIAMVPNPDVLRTVAQGKRDHQIVVGFAAETDDVVANAQKKLASKGADLVVANQVGHGLGFGTDDNKAYLVCEDGVQELPLMSKLELSHAILDACLKK